VDVASLSSCAICSQSDVRFWHLWMPFAKAWSTERHQTPDQGVHPEKSRPGGKPVSFTTPFFHPVTARPWWAERLWHRNCRLAATMSAI